MLLTLLLKWPHRGDWDGRLPWDSVAFAICRNFLELGQHSPLYLNPN
jgi:hypothetical protein